MSGETFERNAAAIGRFLEDTIDSPRHKLWNRLTVYQKATHQRVAMVMRTPYGPVVVVRTAVEDGAEKVQQDKRWNFEPLTGNRRDRWVMTTRRGQFVLRAELLIEHLDAGKEKLTF